MFKRERLALLVIVLATACGTVASPAPTLPPTEVLPTYVAVLPTNPQATGGATAVNNPADATAQQPTTAPTSIPATPTITLIPRKPTATPTPKVIATATRATTAVPGDANSGKLLFANGTGNTLIPACATCHALDETQDVGKVGPVMKGIALRAGKRVSGQDAWTYLHNSIIAPSDFLVPNEGGKVYSVNNKSLMYANYATDLTASQINDLVAYLLTLR